MRFDYFSFVVFVLSFFFLLLYDPKTSHNTYHFMLVSIFSISKQLSFVNVGCVGDILWLVSHFVCILFNETENTAMICFMDSYIISSPNEVVPNVTGSELVGGLRS